MKMHRHSNPQDRIRPRPVYTGLGTGRVRERICPGKSGSLPQKHESVATHSVLVGDDSPYCDDNDTDTDSAEESELQSQVRPSDARVCRNLLRM